MLKDIIKFIYYWFSGLRFSIDKRRNRYSYDNPQLIETVLAAEKLRKRSGLKVRDGVISDNIACDIGLENLIYECIVDGNSEIVVFDIGGSFGATYFETSRAIKPFIKKWYVFEQKRVVDLANANFGSLSEKVTFHYSTELVNDKPTIAYFGSSLQYLPNPLGYLSQVLETKPKFVRLLRTPFTNEVTNLKLLQHCSKPLIEAKYPLEAISAAAFEKVCVREGYVSIHSASSPEGKRPYKIGKYIEFRDLIIKRENND